MQKNNTISYFYEKLNHDPHNPDLYNNLACLYYKINNIENAIYNYKKALYLNPNNWQTHYNLANCYVKKNFIPDAITHYQTSIKIYPENINAIQNLGLLLVDLKNFEEALPYLEKAYLNNNENQTNINFIEQFANCYLQIGNIIKATELLQHSVNLDPNVEATQHNLAILYLRSNNYTLAKKHFNLAITINPNNQTAKHMIAALSNYTTSQAPVNYIMELFDQYANYYNKHVKESLQYKLSEQFRSLYTKYNHLTTVKNTLDLGCGTGLCSIYFRDTTINLIGVDLSKNMLMQAKNLAAYDLLIQTNIQQLNIFSKQHFDLVIAADLLPYFGQLENLFFNIKNIVKDKFKFIFNIELLNINNKNFELQQTGRYTHSKHYIENLATQYGFKILESQQSIIRLQNNIPVNGMIFLLI